MASKKFSFVKFDPCCGAPPPLRWPASRCVRSAPSGRTRWSSSCWTPGEKRFEIHTFTLDCVDISDNIPSQLKTGCEKLAVRSVRAGCNIWAALATNTLSQRPVGLVWGYEAQAKLTKNKTPETEQHLTPKFYTFQLNSEAVRFPEIVNATSTFLSAA